jgi:hypothetical protein
MPDQYNPLNYGGPAMGIGGNALQAGNAAGFYSPQGSPVLRASLRRYALRNASNAMRQNSIATQLYGLDPNQARVAQVNAQGMGAANTADILNQGQLQQQQGAQDWFRQLLGGQMGFEQQAAMQRAAQAFQRSQQFNPWAIGGQLVGAGLGGWAGAGFPGFGGGGGGQQSVGYPRSMYF